MEFVMRQVTKNECGRVIQGNREAISRGGEFF